MSPGQIGYDAYGAAAGWKTFDGRPMPTWQDLQATETGRETCRRWDAAAKAIIVDFFVKPEERGEAGLSPPEFIGMITAGTGR